MIEKEVIKWKEEKFGKHHYETLKRKMYLVSTLTKLKKKDEKVNLLLEIIQAGEESGSTGKVRIVKEAKEMLEKEMN